MTVPVGRAGRLRRAVLGAVAAASLAGASVASFAQSSEDPVSSGGLPPLTVGPSGFEGPEAEARARQERLLARMTLKDGRVTYERSGE